MQNYDTRYAWIGESLKEVKTEILKCRLFLYELKSKQTSPVRALEEMLAGIS